MCGIFEQTVMLGQDNGPDVKLVVSGDESYAHHETPDGYSVVYDTELGLFCYAGLRDGRFFSTRVALDQPPPAGTRRHLKEAPAVRNEKFTARFEARSVPTVNDDGTETFGSAAGLLPGRRVSKGQVRGLTVIVQFADVKAAVSADEVRAMCNSPGYTNNGNRGSVRDYFLTMSGGALDYSNDVVGPITLKNNRSFYHNTLLVKEAMDAVVAAGIDLSRYDSLNAGYVDAVNFLYAGDSQFVDGSNLWPHNSVLELKYGKFRTYFYLLTGLGATAADLSIGTFCHENGHLLCRFPDIYDYGKVDGDFSKSAGMGRYCLMSSGNHLNSGRTPAPICAYFRDLVGWCTNKVDLNKGGRFEAKHGDYTTVMKYSLPKPNEYFLVENRSKLGYDSFLPSTGLAVYHCDILGSNEWQGGTPDKHYQCGLLQADGRLDLETNANQGDGADLFRGLTGVVLSHSTRPASLAWDGAESGLIISNVSAPGEVMSFVVGDEAPKPEGALHAEATANLAIPDASPTGITSTISIPQTGTVRDLRVEVDITHTYVADLMVELVGPAGQRAVLHNRAGGSNDDIKKTFDTTSAPGLSAFTGLGTKGDWVLRVSDLDARDTGRLNRWALSIDVDAAAAGVARGQAAPDLAIPDASPAGVSSKITLAEAGVAREVKVAVTVTHTYIGDLVLTLRSPSGRSAVLHNRTGGSADNIQIAYDPVSTPALAALAGDTIQGDWTLQVADLEAADTGKLVRWELEIAH